MERQGNVIRCLTANTLVLVLVAVSWGESGVTYNHNTTRLLNGVNIKHGLERNVLKVKTISLVVISGDVSRDLLVI